MNLARMGVATYLERVELVKRLVAERKRLLGTTLVKSSLLSYCRFAFIGSVSRATARVRKTRRDPRNSCASFRTYVQGGSTHGD
jgi:hypothetical protein